MQPGTRVHPLGRPPHPDVLTPSEWQVLGYLRGGASTTEVARRRATTRAAVNFHVANMVRIDGRDQYIGAPIAVEVMVAKLGLSGREELLAWDGEPAAVSREALMMKTTTRITSGSPQFRVRDVVRTAEWYRDRLGFDIGEQIVHPAYEPKPGVTDLNGVVVFTHVSRDAFVLQLGNLQAAEPQTNSTLADGASDAYVWVEGLDELRAEFVERGAAPTEIEGAALDLRRTRVTDCDGHVVTFGEIG